MQCTSEIMNWLLRNDLRVNTSKTELLKVYRIPTIFPSLVMYGKLIISSDSVHNIRITMSSTLSFGKHTNAISIDTYKSENYHLHIPTYSI